MQATDFLVDLLPLLDRDGLQESSYLQLSSSNDFLLLLVGGILFILVAIRFKHLALGVKVSELLQKTLLLLHEFSDGLVEIHFSDVDFEDVDRGVKGRDRFAGIRDLEVEACVALNEGADLVERLLFEKAVVVFDLAIELVELSLDVGLELLELL